jgi:hypothetical protein
MPRVRRTLLSLLAVLGLMSALSWTSGALACPANSVATHPVSYGDGCGHAAKPQRHETPANPDGAVCTTMCVAVLPPLVLIGAHPPLAFAPFVGRLNALSGIDPGLDPPPPRAA